MRLLSVLSFSVALSAMCPLSFYVSGASPPTPSVQFSGNVVQAWSNSAIHCISNTTGYLSPPGVGRFVGMLMQAMFDAQSPYTDNWAWNTWNTTLTLPTRRPTAERNDQYRAIAASYAAFGVLKYNFRTFPHVVEELSAFLQEIGLDPSAYIDLLSNNNNNNQPLDFSSPIAVGSTAAGAVIQYHQHDGFNELADEPGTPIGGAPFSDFTNYAPVNHPQTNPLRTACAELSDVNKWQPLRVPTTRPIPVLDNSTMSSSANPLDVYNIITPNATLPNSVQKFVVPQMAGVQPFALNDPAEFRPPPPYRNNSNTQSLLESDMNELVLLSCTLNDTMKVISDYWANGPDNATPPGQWFRIVSDLTVERQLNLLDSTQLMFAVSNAMFDAGIACWDAKRYYDSVRPITAIQCLRGNAQSTAWAGPYQGVRYISLSQFIPYQPETAITPSFAEYVSGHSTFSMAAATILQAFFGSDEFGGSYTALPGSSPIEPKLVQGQAGYVEGLTDVPNNGDPMSIGYSPSRPITLSWSTFTEAAEQAGISRLYGGIHFSHANLEGQALGKKVGGKVWNKVLDLINSQGTSTVLDGSTNGSGSGTESGVIGAPTTCPGAGPNVVVSFADMFNGATINGVKITN